MATYSDPDGGSQPSAVPSQHSSPRPAEPSATPGYGTMTGGSCGPGMQTGATAGSESVYEQARNLASQAKEQSAELAGQAKQQLNTLITEQKARAAERLGGIAGILRETADKLGRDELAGRVGRYATQAADQVESVSRYVRGTDLQSFVRDTGQFARRRPEVFLAGTFLIGLLAARFLKASVERPRQPEMVAGGR